MKTWKKELEMKKGRWEECQDPAIICDKPDLCELFVVITCLASIISMDMLILVILFIMKIYNNEIIFLEYQIC